MRSADAHDYTWVKLKYAGGEPLLYLSNVLDLHLYATSAARRRGIALDGVVLSNGTLLTLTMVQLLRSAHLRLMLSLDGLGEYHDRQRHFPDGKGTSQIVINAIHHAIEGGLLPDISITISNYNAPGLADVVQWVLRHNLPFSLNLCREHSRGSRGLEQSLIISAMRHAYEIIARQPPERTLLTSIADHANLAAPHLYPCSAGRDYLVFDTQGRVAKCQMDMAHTITDCFDADPLSVVRGDEEGFANPSVLDKPACSACHWRYVCAGGCPLQAYSTAGSAYSPSPNCAIYKKLFPQVIQLERLRQIHDR
jgi:uncharacterized protein